MTELVFQCPHCSAISRGGAVDAQEVQAARRSTWRVVCDGCRKESDVPLDQMLLHDPATGRHLHLV